MSKGRVRRRDRGRMLNVDKVGRELLKDRATGQPLSNSTIVNIFTKYLRGLKPRYVGLEDVARMRAGRLLAWNHCGEITWSSFLDAFGVPGVNHEDYLVPDRKTRLGVPNVPIDELTDQIADWDGKVSNWPLGAGRDPLDDLEWLQARSDRDDHRNRFVLLEGYVASVSGEEAARHYFENGFHGRLAVLGGRGRSSTTAAARYLLGSVLASVSVCTPGRLLDVATAERAYELWDSVGLGVGAKGLRILLPGVLSEYELDSLDTSYSTPIPKAIISPRRYLGVIALNLLGTTLIRGGGAGLEKVEIYRNNALRHVGEPVDSGNVMRRINVDLCGLMVALFDYCARNLGDRHRRTAIGPQMDRIEAALEAARDGNELPETKYWEWRTGLGFCRHVFQRRILGGEASTDVMFDDLRRAVAVRQGRGHPCFWIDQIYQFAVYEDRELMQEFRSIVGDPTPMPGFE